MAEHSKNRRIQLSRIEPITYVLGETGEDAARLSIELIEAAGSPAGER